jgi:anti-sigma regulatory factor (Ser/Thr protein kinase)
MNQARELAFLPDPNLLCGLRSEARLVARQLGMASAGDVLSLVIDELVNNAIEHGSQYRRKGEPLRIRVMLCGQALSVDFFDPEMPEAQVRGLARALRAVGDGMPALDGERGRGLFLVAIHMSELRVGVAPGGGLHLQGLLRPD